MPTSIDIGCASWRKPPRKRLNASCGVVGWVTSCSNAAEDFWSGNSPWLSGLATSRTPDCLASRTSGCPRYSSTPAPTSMSGIGDRHDDGEDKPVAWEKEPGEVGRG